MRKIAVISILSLLICSCVTTNRPARDTREPTFLMKIKGDGLDEEITEDFDFDNRALYLRRNATYQILFTINDAGGLKSAAWEYPLQTINPGDLRAARGLIATSNSGDPNREQQSWSPVNFNDDVYSSNLISTNRLVAIGGPLDGTVQNFDWEIEVIDMNNNTTRRTLIYRVTNDPSRIGSRD